jgi:hypothetical protein
MAVITHPGRVMPFTLAKEFEARKTRGLAFDTALLFIIINY